MPRLRPVLGGEEQRNRRRKGKGEWEAEKGEEKLSRRLCGIFTQYMTKRTEGRGGLLRFQLELRQELEAAITLQLQPGSRKRCMLGLHNRCFHALLY